MKWRTWTGIAGNDLETGRGFESEYGFKWEQWPGKMRIQVNIVHRKASMTSKGAYGDVPVNERADIIS